MHLVLWMVHRVDELMAINQYRRPRAEGRQDSEKVARDGLVCRCRVGVDVDYGCWVHDDAGFWCKNFVERVGGGLEIAKDMLRILCMVGYVKISVPCA